MFINIRAGGSQIRGRQGGGARLGSAKDSVSDASHANARASNAVPSVSFARFQFSCGRNENAHRRGTDGRKINTRKYSYSPALGVAEMAEFITNPSSRLLTARGEKLASAQTHGDNNSLFFFSPSH